MPETNGIATMETLDAARVAALFAAVASEMERAKGYLCALDGATGDGDLGVTMVLGCRAILRSLVAADTDVGSVIVRAGTAFGKAAPSTMGALLGTALTTAGSAATGSTEVGLSAIATMAQAAERAIRDRGKAEVGDKTALDAIAPAVQVLFDSVAQRASLRAAFERAEAAARQGLERTTPLKSRLGRAAALGERTVGHPDAGAACVCLVLATIHQMLDREDARGGADASRGAS